ncbi:MAG: tetratricopeptide repeat protein, partial [Desulfobacteraceae bacterium]|nr:tetratricopeptide repeat protein [Desulfobacteraceae bacterium]
MEKILPKEITQKQLVNMFGDIKRLESDDNRFCFLIGAGASMTSGIPTGWTLSQIWHNDLKEHLAKDKLTEWEKGIKFNIKNIGTFYSDLYQKRYEASPKVGYDELKKLMDSSEPDLGYVILSQILAKEKHNFVITTNFDYLIEDAVRIYTSTKPFSAGHETLAEFVSSQTERPTIIKVHRDLFLHPFNDKEKTDELKKEWKKALLPILKNFSLLAIGYGGNDGSLMDYLKEIDPVDRNPIYWCVRNKNPLNSKITELLTEKDFIVTIHGFDELMHALYNVLEYDIFENLDDIESHKLILDAKTRIQNLNKKLVKLVEESQKNEKDNMSEDTKNIFSGASKDLLSAIEEKDRKKQEEKFIKGLNDHPNSPALLGNYAVFLKDIRKDYDKAEKYYKKAVEIDPDNASNLGNYAIFLSDSRKDYDKAEKYYKKTIEIDPDHANNLGNYAIFLSNSRKDYDKAE